MSGSILEKPARLSISYEDDPRVVVEQAIDDYARHVVPMTARAGRWSLAMSMWAVLSALFYLYISVAVAQSVGSVNAIIGMALSVAVYGVINYVIAKRAISSGLTVGLLSRRLFGRIGASITTLLFAVTAIYYAVFEGSIIAVALKQYFAPASDIKWWYLLVVIYALPLVIGGVQVWLDKLNGALLPLYVLGLIYVTVSAGNEYGYSTEFLRIPASLDTAVPGWLWALIVYMGVFVNMMFTQEYARFGKRVDAEFHGIVTFGPVFYLALFIVNGLAGIFIMDTVFPGLEASEKGVAEAILGVSGFIGLLFIIISQTRINSANYYLASINLEGFAARAFGLRWPRLVWVAVAGVCVYVLMLTNVFSYLLKALAWQGVAVTAWVAIVLVHFAMEHGEHCAPEFRPGRIKRVMPGAWALVITIVIGIAIIETGAKGSWYVEAAPIIIGILASASYVIAAKLGGARVIQRQFDPRDEVDDLWGARIECHVCKYSYTALEMDRDPSANQQAICTGCAEGNHEFLQAAHDESRRLSLPEGSVLAGQD